MKIMDFGVLDSSLIDFIIPSEFAKTALYYTDQFGYYHCNNNYKIERNYVDLFLLIYMCDGELFVSSKGHEITAKKEQIILLDCRYPHTYSCPSTAKFLWFHFNGASSHAYCKQLFHKNGILFADESTVNLKKYFESILSWSKQIVPNEHQISVNIHAILSGLATSSSNPVQTVSTLSPVIDYIKAHYHEQIELTQLAKQCNMSVSHLIRCFKKFFDGTPHEYLLSFRLRQAKNLLLTTSISVEIISEKCGFNSASHFARAFRSNHQMTPTEFRKMYL